MKIRNDKFVTPASLLVQSRKAAVRAFLDANVTTEILDFDTVRQSFPPAQQAVMTDGLIHEICNALGVAVVPS